MTQAALRVLDGGAAPRGWEELWAKDQWRQGELPHGDLASTYRGEVIVHFEHLRQPWLKDAAKRWARTRLLGATAPRTMSCYVADLRPFSEWLDAHGGLAAPALLDRERLENYLLWVRTSSWKPATRSRRVAALRMLLDEQRDDALRGLPASARIHGAEVPRVDYRLPKELPEDVFAQFVDPDNLARLETEWHRTVVLLLAYTGLRVSSLVTLPRDALHTGPDGQPYLRYWNIKLRREAMLPIPPALADQLRRHEQQLRGDHPGGTEWLLPSPPGRSRRSAKGGAMHISHSTVARILRAYVVKAGIRGADGRLAHHVHPHLFRHHVGTSMVNDGVPLPVIQKVLDHASIEMTARYAQLHDDTLRREVRRWHERVNVRGERIALPVDGPLEEAAWMKERIARARQALPNGYCGLPLVQTCPHPNACLSCDSFLTDGSFRSVHEQQLEQTGELLASARDKGNLRLVEVLERDHTSLARILEGLDAIESDTAEARGVGALAEPADSSEAA
jgi:site-specific recombinase XerD